MSRVFVDTSGLLAVLVPTDGVHARACAAWNRLEAESTPLVTNSYVLLELYALLGRRFGIPTVIAFRRDFEPLFDVTWIDRTLHDEALDLMAELRFSGLSLVDASAFVTMRALRIETAFAFDPHFASAGFRLTT